MENDEIKIKMEAIYLPSEKVVTRDIEGELIIVPIENGYADFSNSLYSLNETGRTIWELLAPDRSVIEICTRLAQGYSAPTDTIENDVQALLKDLLSIGIIVEVK